MHPIIVNDILGCESEFGALIDEPDSLWMYITEDTVEIIMGDEHHIQVNHNAFNPSFQWGSAYSNSASKVDVSKTE